MMEKMTKRREDIEAIRQSAAVGEQVMHRVLKSGEKSLAERNTNLVRRGGKGGGCPLLYHVTFSFAYVYVCVRVCACVCVRACACVCVHVYITR